jgi:nucleotide-binding universal stress UspA family protein
VSSFARVVVALDGSEPAAQALAPAADIASKFDAELVLVRCVHTIGELERSPSTVPDASRAEMSQDVVAERWREEERAAAASYLSSQVKSLQGQGIKATSRLLEGPPAAQLLIAAQDQPDSLLVLTAYGSTGAHTPAARAVFGGTADEVLRNARLPVLVIRPQL